MSTLKKTLAVGSGSVLVLASVTSGLALAAPSDAPASVTPDVSVAEVNEAYEKTDIVTLDTAVGSFAYTQGDVSSNADIKAAMGASRYLCGARPVADGEAVSAEDWAIEVRGEVKQPFVASFEEMAQSDDVQSLLLGCACAGNPADGKAQANAEVTGISVRTMIGLAGVNENANTIVFTSADGYEVALPLSYVKQRYCPIVFDVNGAPLAESVGGTNQLWLGSTSANYFARDIVTITLEERKTPPPSPSSDEARAAYGNLPNIGVSLGGTIE